MWLLLSGSGLRLREMGYGKKAVRVPIPGNQVFEVQGNPQS